MRYVRAGLLSLGAAAVLLASPLAAQERPAPARASDYSVLDPVHLYEGAAPGSEGWEFEETLLPDGSSVFNVTDPTYTAYIPAQGEATGTAAIIAPGGAFRVLAMDNEGHAVAEWLAERGIAAFVLKYRLQQIEDLSLMMQSMQEVSMAEAGQWGVADGIEALAQIRARSDEYGVDPDKVVFIGFSAGAHLASYVGLAEDPALRPDYVAPIYGAPFGGVPAFPAAGSEDSLPPFFLALAQDDPLVMPDTMAFYEALMEKGYRPELHLYSRGGHGFGMRRQGASSDYFIEDLYHWMEANGLTLRPGDPPLPEPAPAMWPPQ